MDAKNENSKEIIERLSQVIDYKGENFTQLGLKIGVSNSYFSKMVRNNGSIGAEIISKIVKYYDDLSVDWLLTGRGNMLRNDVNQNMQNFQHTYISDNKNSSQIAENQCKNTKNISHSNTNCIFCHAKDMLLTEKDERIVDLKKQIADLEKHVGDLNKHIDTLTVETKKTEECVVNVMEYAKVGYRQGGL